MSISKAWDDAQLHPGVMGETLAKGKLMDGKSSKAAIHLGCVIWDLPGFSRDEVHAFHPCPFSKLQLLSTSGAKDSRSHLHKFWAATPSDPRRQENENQVSILLLSPSCSFSQAHTAQVREYSAAAFWCCAGATSTCKQLEQGCLPR